jgi:hypothetical protein
MKVITWNIRGLNNPRKKRILRNRIRKEQPIFVLYKRQNEIQTEWRKSVNNNGASTRWWLSEATKWQEEFSPYGTHKY